MGMPIFAVFTQPKRIRLYGANRLFQGMRMKDAVKEVSALPGFTRNEVYKASLEVAAFLEGEDEEG